MQLDPEWDEFKLDARYISPQQTQNSNLPSRLTNHAYKTECVLFDCLIANEEDRRCTTKQQSH